MFLNAKWQKRVTKQGLEQVFECKVEETCH
jgi:hypothetical protein